MTIFYGHFCVTVKEQIMLAGDDLDSMNYGL